MKKPRYTDQQIAQTLRQAEQGTAVARLRTSDHAKPGCRPPKPSSGACSSIGAGVGCEVR